MGVSVGENAGAVSVFSASPCLLAQQALNQTGLDLISHSAMSELCDPRQVS